MLSSVPPAVNKIKVRHSCPQTVIVFKNTDSLIDREGVGIHIINPMTRHRCKVFNTMSRVKIQPTIRRNKKNSV